MTNNSTGPRPWDDPERPAEADPAAPENFFDEPETLAGELEFAEASEAIAAPGSDPLGADDEDLAVEGVIAPPPIDFPAFEEERLSAVVEAPPISAFSGAPEARGLDGAFLGDATLPRISIHAFVERPETAQMLQAAASDRRLAKTAFNVSMGGVPAAIVHFSATQSANLVVIESSEPQHKLLADLDHLAEFCDAGTRVIVIGAQNDIGLYRELMRRGVSEYLVPPLHPLHFIRAAAALYGDATAPFVGRSIAFVGAKGGVGSSTVCHNVAWSLSSRVEVNTTLVDLDLSFGTSGLDFNQDSSQGVADALASPDRVDDVILDRLLTRCTERLTLFSAPASIDRMFDFAPVSYQTVIERVRRTVPFVVLDIPHVWQPWVRQTLADSDDVVIVATPDLSCLRNAKNLVDLLRGVRRNDAPPKVVLNMVGVPKRPEIPVKDFGEALGVTPSLVLPFDPQLFAQAANNGQMLSEVAPQSKTVEGIEHLSAQIAGRSIAPRNRSLLGKLAMAKR